MMNMYNVQIPGDAIGRAIDRALCTAYIAAKNLMPRTCRQELVKNGAARNPEDSRQAAATGLRAVEARRRRHSLAGGGYVRNHVRGARHRACRDPAWCARAR